MRLRKGNKIENKIQMLVFGMEATGKSTFACDLCKIKNRDGNPTKLLVVDVEGGGCDGIINDLNDDPEVNTENIVVAYTQNFNEVIECVNKARRKEPFMLQDENGKNTGEYLLDASGKPFIPTAIFIDGATVLTMSIKQNILDISKKRNKMRALKSNIIGEEKQIKIETSKIELSDYQIINSKGDELALALTGSDLHYVISVRGKLETKSRSGGDGIVLEETGKIIADGFKNMGYNVGTELYFYRENGIVKAAVLKDRLKVKKIGETWVNPSILEYQEKILSAGEQKFNLHSFTEDSQKEADKFAESIGLDILEKNEENIEEFREIIIEKLNLLTNQKLSILRPLLKQKTTNKIELAGLDVNNLNILDLTQLDSILKTL